ncbi:MAG: hypothetical protein ACREYE_20080 [Gammaproteobacteria bacterium]
MNDIIPSELTSVSETQWAEARRCFAVMQRLSQMPRRTAEHVAAAAAELGYSRAQAYVLLNRYPRVS